MKPAARRELFARLAELDPSPKTELEYATPFELLVAVMLSAQSTDVGVNKATRRLFPVANTPAALVALGVEKLKPFIATIGLFNTKAANVVAMSAQVIERHGGEVPRSREALEALPGVGRKTANVVLNTAFGEPVMAVDTHIFRVANRTGLARGTTVRAVEDGLMEAVPRTHSARAGSASDGRRADTRAARLSSGRLRPRAPSCRGRVRYGWRRGRCACRPPSPARRTRC